MSDTLSQTGTASSAETQARVCRAITPEEAAHYEAFGWVKLKQFVDPEMVGKVLGVAREKMGEDGDSNAPYGRNVAYFNAEGGGGLTNPAIRPLLEQCSENAKLLIDRDVQVQYFTDVFAAKLPHGKQTRNEGNGPTGFHQDFISFACDRSGGMTFWIALEDYTPEFGTMSFVSGSHRVGVLGTFTKGDARDHFPALRKLDTTEPMSYEVGDVTVHSHLTIHGAGVNLTDRPRWGYLVTLNPADVVWTGAPPEAFDPSGMEPWQPFPEDRFPILA